MRLYFRIIKYHFFTAFVSLVLVFCAKQDEFLNKKPNVSLSTITSVADCQLLLNNENILNNDYSSLGQLSDDDYYLSDANWLNEDQIQQQCYIWGKTIYPAGSSIKDWNAGFLKTYYANTVLDALNKVDKSSIQIAQYNQVKGSALFFRAFASYDLLQTFSPQYDSAISTSQLGIPVHLNSNPEVITTRSSESDCYNQIIGDLNLSLQLLPSSSVYPTQPNKASAFGLLTRLYMTLGNFKLAHIYADSCLSYNNKLIDFNTLAPQYNTLVPNNNGYIDEDIFHAAIFSQGSVLPHFKAITDSLLYKSYDSNDLRKTIFFTLTDSIPYFIGSYDFKGQAYCGIATDEIYLDRAECSARLGNTNAALTDLNNLLQTRWVTGKYSPFNTSDSKIALTKILSERRKELLFRGLRWIDLKRLNKDQSISKTLTRFINGNSYSLPPNDPRYALPIPDDEIKLSGIQQNPR
jgi:starch-binding outer membrane protein, SusD/RagB family